MAVAEPPLLIFSYGAYLVFMLFPCLICSYWAIKILGFRGVTPRFVELNDSQSTILLREVQSFSLESSVPVSLSGLATSTSSKIMVKT